VDDRDVPKTLQRRAAPEQIELPLGAASSNAAPSADEPAESEPQEPSHDDAGDEANGT
jgi:hypothetical protein